MRTHESADFSKPHVGDDAFEPSAPPDPPSIAALGEVPTASRRPGHGMASWNKAGAGRLTHPEQRSANRLSGRLNKPQLHFRTLALKPPPAPQAGNEVGLETWREQTQRMPSDRLDRPRMPQDALSLFRLPPPAATPAEATPDSPSAVLRHSQVQFIRGKPLHGADEVENVVLILCRDQLPKQL